MVIEKAYLEMMRKYKDTLDKAYANRGEGAYKLEHIEALERIYRGITNDSICRSCNRMWLYRLGLWYNENVATNEQKEVEQPKRRGRRPVS